MKKISTRSHALDLFALNLRTIEPRPNLDSDPWNSLKINEEVMLCDSEFHITVEIKDIFDVYLTELYWNYSKKINPYCDSYSDFLDYLEYYKLDKFEKIRCFKINVLDFTII